MPEAGLVTEGRGRGGAPASESVGYDEHKPRTPPPDLPSLLLDSRITYLGMPVSAPPVCLCVSAAPPAKAPWCPSCMPCPPCLPCFDADAVSSACNV